MTPLACQLLPPASPHFPCSLRTWWVLANVSHKTVPLSRSLQPCSPPACAPAGDWHLAAKQQQRGKPEGALYIKKTTAQPLKPPGTKLCNNWLVHPCDPVTARQKEPKGGKHPLDSASAHLKSSAVSFTLLSSHFTSADHGFSPWELLGGQARCQICLYTVPG